MELRTTVIAASLALAFGIPAAQAQQQNQKQGATQAQGKQQGAQQQAQKGQQQKGIVSLSGKVVGKTDVKSTAGDLHHVVKVQTGKDKNNIAVVDLGFKAPTVDPGDRIFVSGYSARINGKPVIFARYVGKLEEVAMAQQADGGAGTGSGAPHWSDDQFGTYDRRLNWTADDSGFNTFYGDADEAWGNYYDDVGDEGWFDV